jgi:membrane protein DedA with SNARE-associated domain
MFDGLLDLASTSPWAYLAILAIAALDAVVPLVPSEATVISAGVLAGAGELSIALVIAAGAAGALAGDNGAYVLGRTLGPRFGSRIPRRRREWADEQLERRGGTIVLAARFVPGGRTVTTLTAGIVRMSWRRFAGYSLLAASVWATFAALLGYVGGTKFEDDPHYAFALAAALAVGVYAVIEVGRRHRLGKGWAIPPIRGPRGDDRLPA